MKKRFIKVLMVKTSLDSHWRGPMVVSMALRDAGMEVIWGGMLNAHDIAAIAIAEDVDVIGFNIGGRYQVVKDLLKILKEKELEDVLFVAGGTIPPEDIAKLKEIGIAGVFPPGSSLNDIVDFIRNNVSSEKGVA